MVLLVAPTIRAPLAALFRGSITSSKRTCNRPFLAGKGFPGHSTSIKPLMPFATGPARGGHSRLGGVVRARGGTLSGFGLPLDPSAKVGAVSCSLDSARGGRPERWGEQDLLRPPLLVHLGYWGSSLQWR